MTTAMGFIMLAIIVVLLISNKTSIIEPMKLFL